MAEDGKNGFGDMKIGGVDLASESLEGKIALKDFVITQNEFRADIKTGDDLSDIPVKYHDNLKTEGVI